MQARAAKSVPDGSELLVSAALKNETKVIPCPYYFKSFNPELESEPIDAHAGQGAPSGRLSKTR